MLTFLVRVPMAFQCQCSLVHAIYTLKWWQLHSLLCIPCIVYIKVYYIIHAYNHTFPTGILAATQLLPTVIRVPQFEYDVMKSKQTHYSGTYPSRTSVPSNRSPYFLHCCIATTISDQVNNIYIIKYNNNDDTV